ncbi:hypothetical protein [Winogradskyella ursingii]|uniref:hypothetical protein n=1 Tax=Winogradskyella ursingii TaxID=2686079 RepID=UPI0015C78CB8|nr:hypothetical protein [Winogradskyella ursingii]
MQLSNLFRHLKIKIALIFLIPIALSSGVTEPLNAQSKNFENVVGSLKEYAAPYREVTYAHLNKSTFIKGEMIGFSAYVFDKDLKIPSKLTKNLYCTISDENNKVIKSKLIKINNGFAHNVFNIDSTFTSGNYTFNAYTNWMRNFDEPNAYTESFKVINPDEETIIKKTVTEHILDAQFLPEGGNFIDDVKTTVGVIIKNIEGFGVADIEGTVYDSNNQLITTFKTSKLGIGRFLLHPKMNQEFLVKINHLNKDFNFKIDDIQPKGISINITNTSRKLVVGLNTNDRTLEEIRGKRFQLLINNGKDAKSIGVSFNEKSTVKTIENEQLFSGINILTLFDENNRPVLERMVFNYEGIERLTTDLPTIKKIRDSMQIKVPISNLADTSLENSNISISVLPEATKSYHKHQNIISQSYLQPYVNGYIENAHYYFTDIDGRKKYELDNLLITQGWSSYNWNTIFNYKSDNNFVFEDGILLKANQNNKKNQNFMVYPLKNNDGIALNLSEDNNSFVVSSLYPEGDESLGISSTDKKGKADQPNLYLQFFPSKIPEYNYSVKALPTNQSTISELTSTSPFTLRDIKETQMLEEILVKGDSKIEKIKRLQGDAFSDIDVFDDAKRRMNMTFTNYINSFIPTYYAYESTGNVTIVRRLATTLFGSAQSPIVYLDDMLIPNLNYFYGYNMNTVDYVTVNKNGLGEGFFGANGVIKIYTSLDFIKSKSRTAFKQFQFPITFSESKRFYVPKYEAYKDDFFKTYGVIDWFPDCKIDHNGNLTFTIYNPANNNLKLFIEGVTEDGKFLSEVKVLNISSSN